MTWLLLWVLVMPSGTEHVAIVDEGLSRADCLAVVEDLGREYRCEPLVDFVAEEGSGSGG